MVPQGCQTRCLRLVPIGEPVTWCHRDVRLGVLEPVPIGEPVTWCHRDVRLGVLEPVPIGEPVTWCHIDIRLGVLEPVPIGEPVTWCHRDIRLGVLEPVPIGEPVTWCPQDGHLCKKNGKPRRTIDFHSLNTHATRETHHTQSPFHQARSVPHNKKKTVFDDWNGYHSVPLHRDDRHYTTFINLWERYRYLTAPQGYISSGDGYSRRYDEIVSTFSAKTKCIDDTLLWADTIKESFFQASQWLDICGRNGITLNPKILKSPLTK